MSIFKELKKEIAYNISKFLPIKINKGLSKGMMLYGNLFYNLRSNELNKEEILYENLFLKDKVIIEAGAHIGTYTLYFSKQVGKGKILAFEPNPICYYFLCKNIRKNRLKNVITVNAGLSYNNGVLYFLSDKYNTAKGTFKSDKQEIIRKNKRRIIEKEIPVTTIDNAVKKYELGRVDFIKIDTEGFEPFIIEGMKEVLKRFKPIIYFEIHGLDDIQKKEDLKRIFEFVREFDYTVIKLSKGLPEVTQDNIEDFRGGGYIASYGMSQSLELVLTQIQS